MKHRFKRRFAQMVFRMRTAGATPGRQAIALGVGVFVGCTPLFGLHLGICLVLARVLRLSPVTMYAGAQISYPVFAPFLYYGELQTGALVRRGHPFEVTLSQFRDMDHDALVRMLLTAIGDLVLGSAVVGVILGALFALLGHQFFSRAVTDPDRTRVADAASRRYLEASIFDWEYARGKLKSDIIYTLILRRRLLPDDGLLVDLGCGRGLLMALVHEAELMHAAGAWPETWPPPPARLKMHGIERRLRHAAVAKTALGPRAVIEIGDLREAIVPECQAATLIDVLHYLGGAEQERIVALAAASVAPGGVLLLRETDKSSLWRFIFSSGLERAASILRGHFWQRFHFRPVREWADLLRRAGMQTEIVPSGRLHPNVLVIGRRPA